MRVVFMGTPDFAAASLKKLIEENFDIAAVYTMPDKARGRGMKLSAGATSRDRSFSASDTQRWFGCGATAPARAGCTGSCSIWAHSP